MTKRVYFDYAATTPTDPEVVRAMESFFTEDFGNPSGLYEEGRSIKHLIAQKRSEVATLIGARSAEELIFTGSGTESDALALMGVMRKHGGHLIVGATEHHAVLNNAELLKKEGFDVDFAPVDGVGIIDIEALRELIRPETTLISIMFANNEIGTIAPMRKIKKLLTEIREERKEQGNETPIFWHTDACQAAAYLDINVAALGVDLLTLNGSKIYGPKGIGLLYVRRGVQIAPLWRGGGQERKLRSGTENVPGIVGLARALQIATEKREEEAARIASLRDELLTGILKTIPKVVANGPTGNNKDGMVGTQDRLANNVNVSILDIEGEALLLYLDNAGIAASTGSACDSITLDPSHVILALGKPYEFAHASMRFTLGRGTTKEDVAHLLKVLPGIVETLRKVSPLNLDIDAKEMTEKKAFIGEGLPHWERKNTKAGNNENIKTQA